MNKKVILIVVLVFCFLFFKCKKLSNKNCKPAKDLIEASIESINSMDEKEYISLIESNIVLEILKNSSEENPEHKELVEVLKNDKEEFIKMYSIGYNVFIRTLKRIYKLNRIDFKLIDFKLEKTEEESGYIIDRYVVKLEDYKNDHWSMKINLSKYNNCYYIMEPINVNYLSKGW